MASIVICRMVIRDDEWNKYYVIEAPKGREHKILLDRQLVSLPENFPYIRYKLLVSSENSCNFAK